LGQLLRRDMKWSLKLGRWAGIDVYLHVTFLLLLGVVALVYWREEPSLRAVARGVGFFVAVFGCVLLHEFGHALTARRYGVRTRDITLLPIGGVARLERMPDKPIQELWVALAGPAVNVVIAALLLVALAATSGLRLERLGFAEGALLERLLLVNLFMVGFNLLPAFPMDGGRVLRSLLALRMDYARATQIAATLGQVMAVLFVIAGFLLSHVMLMVIAFFVWIGAAQETNMAQVRAAMGGIPVEEAMLTDFQTLEPEDSLDRVVELITRGSQQDFPVLRDGAVVGVLTRNRLVAALARHGASARVGEVMEREVPVAQAGELIETALERVQGEKGAVVPVYRDGRLIGLLTAENIGEFVTLRRALAAARRGRGLPPVIAPPRG
jgi:Zn-dependent protease/predicted transcriptional regulator